jgi:hypothetical protein
MPRADASSVEAVEKELESCKCEFKTKVLAAVEQMRHQHESVLAGLRGTSSTAFGLPKIHREEKFIVDSELCLSGELASRIWNFVASGSVNSLPPLVRAELCIWCGESLTALGELSSARNVFYSQVESTMHQIEGTDLVAATLLKAKAILLSSDATIRLLTARDPRYRCVSTLQLCLDQLQRIQQSMQACLSLPRDFHERAAQLIHSCTLTIYDHCEPMIGLGFGGDVSSFLAWCAMCMETIINLSTVGHLRWRTRLYAATCYALEGAGGIEDAQKWAGRAYSKVRQLRLAEEMDPPLPDAVRVALEHSEAILAILSFKYDALLVEQQSPDEGALDLQALFDRHGIPSELQQRAILETLRRTRSVDSDSQVVKAAVRISLEASRTDHLNVQQWMLLAERLIALQEWDAFRSVASHLSSNSFIHSSPRLQWKLDVLCCLDEFVEWSSSASVTEWKELTLTPNPAYRLSSLLLASFRKRELNAIEAQPDLLEHAAFALWWKCGAPLVSFIDPDSRIFYFRRGDHGQEEDQGTKSVAKTAIAVLDAVHLILTALDVDDSLLRSTVALNLAILLAEHARNRRRAVQVLTTALSHVELARSLLVDAMLHLPSTKVDRIALATSSITATRNEGIRGEEKGRERPGAHGVMAGLFGAGADDEMSQQAIAHIHAALVNAYYRIDLELGQEILMSAKGGIGSPRVADGSIEAAPVSSCHAERAALPYCATTEARLLALARKNPYKRALLLVEMSRYRATVEDRSSLLREAMSLLHDAVAQEERHLADASSCPPSLSYVSHEDDTPSQGVRSSGASLPPALVSRSSTCIVVQPWPQPGWESLCVFAKPAGVGTAVSVHCTDCVGSGVPVPVDPRTGVSEAVALRGLQPNESYVYAVSGNVSSPVGKTSEPVVSLEPLPLISCWAHVAETALELGCLQICGEACCEIFNYMVNSTNIGVDEEHESTSAVASWDDWAISFQSSVVVRASRFQRSSSTALKAFVGALFVLVELEGSANLTVSGPGARRQQLQRLDGVRKMSMAADASLVLQDWSSLRQAASCTLHLLRPLLTIPNMGKCLLAYLLHFQQCLASVPAGAAWDEPTRKVYNALVYHTTCLGREIGETDAVLCAISTKGAVCEVDTVRSNPDAAAGDPSLSDLLLELWLMLPYYYSTAGAQTSKDAMLALRGALGLPPLINGGPGTDVYESISLHLLKSPADAWKFLHGDSGLALRSSHAVPWVSLCLSICAYALSMGLAESVIEWMAPESNGHLFLFQDLSEMSQQTLLAEGESISVHSPYVDSTDGAVDDTRGVIPTGSAEMELGQLAEAASILGRSLLHVEFARDSQRGTLSASKCKFTQGPYCDLSLPLDPLLLDDSTALISSNIPAAVGIDGEDATRSESTDKFHEGVAHLARAAHRARVVGNWATVIKACTALWNSIISLWLAPHQFQGDICHYEMASDALLYACEQLRKSATAPTCTSWGEQGVLMDEAWVVQFIQWGMMAMLHRKQWRSLVATGRHLSKVVTANSSTHIMTVYAQRELLRSATDRLEKDRTELNKLEVTVAELERELSNHRRRVRNAA